MTLPKRMTYEEFRQLPGDERYEFLEGELLVTPAPSRRHQAVSMALSGHLWRFTLEQSLGEILCAPLDLILPDGNILQPDILFIKESRRPADELQGGVHGAPDLVIEILSPTSVQRDTVQKREVYSRNGVQEYWIVDPTGTSVEVLTQQGDGLELWQRFARESTLTSPLLPGLELDLSAVFG